MVSVNQIIKAYMTIVDERESRKRHLDAAGPREPARARER